MPRRAAAQIRPVEPDAVHRSKLVAQVINKVMLDGKKSTAERIVYDALALLAERSDKDPVETLEASIRTLTPALEVRSRRVGGATYQVPVEVPRRARARSRCAGSWSSRASAARRRWRSASQTNSGRPLPAGRRLQAQGRHLPHGAGQQGLRALPLVGRRGPHEGGLTGSRHPRIVRALRGNSRCATHRRPTNWARPPSLLRCRCSSGKRADPSLR